MIYMSAGWRNERNATDYIEGVKEWQTKYGIDGVYSDGLPQDDFLVADEIVRMLRELFPSGPLVFHDTLDGYPSTFRPFLHAYATATIMAEGIVNTDGLGWQWPRSMSAVLVTRCTTPLCSRRTLPLEQWSSDLIPTPNAFTGSKRRCIAAVVINTTIPSKHNINYQTIYNKID